MSETRPLTMEVLKKAMEGHAAAFRCLTEYQPAGGIGDKVFPPTYEGGKYAVEKRVTGDGEIVDCVLLDSVQSQANRMELALLDALRAKRIDKLPLLTVRFDHESLAKKFSVTSLEAPHRAADAIFRDSKLGGVMFRKSDKGKVLDTADVRNATGLFGLCPTALVFGIWDSTGPRGGLGAKFQRALVSEMVGWDANKGVNTGSRIDPLGIARAAGPVFRTKDDGWTSDPELAEKVGGKPALFGLSKGKLVAFDETKDQDQGAPSKINHGNVTPDFAFARDRNGNIIKEEDGTPRIRGGFTLSKATQTTVLSLTVLRRLRFPLNGAADSSLDVDRKAHTALAAMGLAAAVLAREEGADLRSRCQLFAQLDCVWELLDVPGKKPPSFALDGTAAVQLLKDAVAEATAAGLPWEGEIQLAPSDDLVALVRKSQQLAMHQAEGDD